MALLTVEQIVAELQQLGHKTSIRTVNRQLSFLKKSDAKVYASSAQRQGKKVVYQKNIIVPYLRDFDQHKSGKPAPAVKTPKPKKAPAPEVKETFNPRAGEKRRQYKEPAPDSTNLLEDILAAPVVFFAPDADTRAAFEKFRTPVERGRFELAISICAEYALGLDGLEYCALKYGVPVRTFHQWTHGIAEVAHLYKKAKVKRTKARSRMFAELGEDSLLKLVTGQTWDQVETTYEERAEPDGSITQVPKARRVIRKFTTPTLGAIVYALNNRMPKRWKNQQHIVTGPANGQATGDDLAKRSDAELLAIIKEFIQADPAAAQLLLNPATDETPG